MCIVDDPSGSDASMWFGLKDDDDLPMPPPMDPFTGQPHSKFPPIIKRPKAAAILEIQNGAVYDCYAGGGTVFNSTLMMRFGKRHYSLRHYKSPPPVKPPGLKVQHLDKPIVSLCIPFGRNFQHQALDMVPKLSMLLPFLEKHPEIQVCSRSKVAA